MATQARTKIQEPEVITEQSLALLEIAGLGCSGFQKINKNKNKQLEDYSVSSLTLLGIYERIVV
jgi:hypothetical protein